MMEEENKNYKKILEILKQNKPALSHPEDVENEIIRRIRDGRGKSYSTVGPLEILFGWVNIGWARKSMVAVSILLISVFIYQQTTILKQIKKIGNQPVVVVRNEPILPNAGAIESKLTILRFSGKPASAGDIRISDRQFEQLIESYNKLQTEYSNLVRIIEKDPELKEFIDKKLKEEKKINPDI